MNKGESYHAAIFAPDGELLGAKIRKLSELSPRWLGICEAILNDHGPVFRMSPGQMLSHIEIKLTSSGGSGLGVFYVHGALVLSTAYFLGSNPAAEAEIEAMFLSSLRATPLVQQAAASSRPFGALASLSERPLCVFILWGAQSISAQDNDLIRELSEHFAGAIVKRGCNVA